MQYGILTVSMPKNYLFLGKSHLAYTNPHESNSRKIQMTKKLLKKGNLCKDLKKCMVFFDDMNIFWDWAMALLDVHKNMEGKRHYLSICDVF